MKRTLLFWIWNDCITPDAVQRQIADFHRKHVDGFFIHAMPEEFRPKDFPGGMPGYLSEHFFSMVALAAECAKKYGMELWLYDEGGWPSGTINGQLLAEHPELAMHHILPSGEIVAEAGRPDLLNPETTAFFIQGTHEEYAKRLSAYFGSVIPGIFTDEPYFGVFEPDTRLPWSPVLEERFQERKHYPLRTCAMNIFHGNDPQSRIDFCEVWSSLMADSYLKVLQQWCHDHHLLFTGHFNGDDCVKNMVQLLGCDLFQLLRCFDVPGCDAIWRQIHPLVSESDFPRITTSAAQGKPTISESFAVYGADLSLAEMKQIAAMQFAYGITIIAPMAFHYSNRGGRQVTTCSDISGVDPRWENYAQFSDFLRRMSKISDRTKPIIRASVPFPVNALRQGAADPGIFQQGLALAERQITYDYAPDVPPVSGEIMPDLILRRPCPALRTRHLCSPRGERCILVNAGISPLRCQFSAPAGFNVWYDPATGRRAPACADQEGYLNLELPFGGVMVLLTLPGRSQKKAAPPQLASERKILFRREAVVKAFRAGENGLQAITPVPAELAPDMGGTVRWQAEIEADAAGTVILELPEARRTICKLSVNGQESGTRLWGPYQWKIALKAGKNQLAVDITGTPAQAVHAPAHLRWLKERGFLNTYLSRCAEFQPLFPDEEPLKNAFVRDIMESEEK